MIALSVQTLLLMGAVYFLGAALACVLRRALFAAAGQQATERRVDPLPEAAQRARFAGSQEPRPQPPAAHRPAAPAPSAAPPAAAASAPQDLKRIKLIDAAVEGSLNKLGVTRYEQIAQWMQADVKRFGQALGLQAGRINQENWIEQAQVLAKGGETHYSSRRARGEAASAEPTADEGERRAPSPGNPTLPRAMSPGGVAAVVTAAPVPQADAKAPAPATPPRVEERAAFANRPAMAAAPAPEPAVPVRPSPPATRDNLLRIGGISPEISQALNALGVSRYSQLALWTSADVERLDKQLETGGRIARENWIEQAQILSRGGDTAFSREYDRRAQGQAGATAALPTKLADAIREQSQRSPRGDIGGLRSVRSEAFQGGEAGSGQTRVVRSAATDDLKRIRGIGVLIEKKLNSMGVVAYEQIANWTAQDIDRVSQSLDFKGRIERENWIEQARILASGGATEFSRRVDRGEVETSRLKS